MGCDDDVKQLYHCTMLYAIRKILSVLGNFLTFHTLHTIWSPARSVRVYTDWSSLCDLYLLVGSSPPSPSHPRSFLLYSKDNSLVLPNSSTDVDNWTKTRPYLPLLAGPDLWARVKGWVFMKCVHSVKLCHQPPRPWLTSSHISMQKFRDRPSLCHKTGFHNVALSQLGTWD